MIDGAIPDANTPGDLDPEFVVERWAQIEAEGDALSGEPIDADDIGGEHGDD